MTATRRTLDIYLTVLDLKVPRPENVRPMFDFKMTIVWYPQSRSSRAKVLKWEKSQVEVEFDFYITFTIRLHEFSLLQSVLGEIWHLMDQFKISIHHGLCCPFARAFRDALLLPDPENKAAVEQVLEKCNTTFAEKVLCKQDWVWQCIKHFVRPPEVLVSQVCAVLQNVQAT